MALKKTVMPSSGSASWYPSSAAGSFTSSWKSPSCACATASSPAQKSQPFNPPDPLPHILHILLLKDPLPAIPRLRKISRPILVEISKPLLLSNPPHQSEQL